MNTKEIIDYWQKSSKEDLRTAKGLFKLKRYSHCLFFCHLLIEKALKALITKKTNQIPPFGHNLLRLAELCNITIPQDKLDLLAELTTFNINARYDDYKFNFFKKATRSYTLGYFNKTKSLYLWLKKHT